MHIHIQKQILQVFVFLPTILGDEKHVTTKKTVFSKKHRIHGCFGAQRVWNCEHQTDREFQKEKRLEVSRQKK